MATLTRLASTLTAKFSPSQTLTDAFYIDGRLCGKREQRQADITIEKEERGYFFSVFTHPTVEGLEPGMLPPFEPQFRSLCNDVKFGHKEIDGLIEKFLSTAVEVTGKMRLTDSEMRSPYFSGIIVRDAEAFAVTVGNGLAFLYRDDTLFPLTDAGIPMEAIDAFDNRVGDFMYYCASKTANALWSNYFTLSPDDCIILCNKAVYDALGQRELLRILNEAEDQCDAAGSVITQAAARMPNVPMQFSISFVENVTNTDKRGIFGFKKKSKEEDESENNVESVMEGGVVGAAAEAVSDAGFVSMSAAEAAGTFVAADAAAEAGGVIFGAQSSETLSIPVVNQQASGDNGIELDKTDSPSVAPVQFLDNSVNDPAEVKITPEDLLKNSLEQMQPISVSEYNPEEDDEPTKPVEGLDSSIFAGLKEGGILASALQNMEAENKAAEPDVVAVAPAPEPEPQPEFVQPVQPVQESAQESVQIFTDEPVQAQPENKDEIVFNAVDDGNKFMDVPTEESFNPYSAGDPEEMKNAAPLVFGDDTSVQPEKVEEPAEEISEIPVPDFKIDDPKPELKDEDRLNVDFPESDAVKAAGPAKEEQGFTLPFANEVETDGEPDKSESIPDMPEFSANVYDTPVNAVGSDVPVDAPAPDAYAYGQYNNTVDASADTSFTATGAVGQEEPPYQPFGSEVFGTQDQNAYQQQSYQQDPYANNYTNPVAETYTEPAGSASSSGSTGDDAWIMDLLGVDDNNDIRDEIPDSGPFVAGAGAPAAGQQAPRAQSQAVNRGNSYNAGPSGPTGTQRRPGGAPNGGQRPQGNRPAGGGSGNRNGGGKVKYHINRNGYIFIAFVVLLIICLIVMISLISKACSAKNTTETTDPNAGAITINTDITTEPTTIATTAETTEKNPSAPIAKFIFSDYVGYRTWWDLFYYVYGIKLSDLSDPRIQIIKDYNGFASDYTPHSGDLVLLPPEGVLDGSIPNTFVPGTADGGENAGGTGETTAETAAGGEDGANPAGGTPDGGEGAGNQNGED